ncbi:hypothetical protein F5141DRAFT_1109512 [Pisolithus sp. B1]|nr:hypothetical protein F5141DRAFT_1109512 [Pisolithus sp. B1]
MNLALSCSGTPHFGTDSMFESSVGRQSFADMDAPLTASICDVFGDTTFSTSAPPQKVHVSETTPSLTPVYVVIFGYPPYKYSVTVMTSNPEPNTEAINCFRIRYKDATEAMRAIRRNREAFASTYMSMSNGLQDLVLAADLVSSSRQPEYAASTPPNHHPPHLMVVVSPPPPTSAGTHIRLVPSAAAFRKPGLRPGTTSTQKPAAPAPITGTPGRSPSAKNKAVQIKQWMQKCMQ